MKMLMRIMIVFLLFLGVFMVRPNQSYAYWRGHVWIGVGLPGPYYYGYPYYYYPPYYPYATVVDATSYQPMLINGTTYYLNNGVYYIYTQYGYQAVAAPAGALAAPAATTQAAPAPSIEATSDDAVTVNIPNKSGGYTAVVLKKKGNGFVGPQGEFYSDFPKVSQLQTMYGK